MLVKQLRVGMLQYFIGDEYIYCTLLRADETIDVFRLMAYSDAFPLIDQLYDAIEGHFPHSHRAAVFDRFSFQWGKDLLPPICELSTFDVILLVPFGSLHGLPLHAIWIEQQQQFLAQWKALSYCPSSSLLLRCTERNPVRRHDLKDWQFDLNDGAPIVAPTAAESCVSFAVDVKHGNTVLYEKVAANFAKHFKVHDTLDGSRTRIKAATLLDHQRSDQPWDVVCIVSHGYWDAVSPEDSGLLLNQNAVLFRQISTLDKQVYLFRDLPFRYVPPEIQTDPNCIPELFTISEMRVDCLTHASLVTLFGCSTATGEVQTADDYTSLAAQWLKVGASSVIASLWELDIDFLNAWVPAFLTNWKKKGQPKALACQTAINEILSDQSKLRPYDWAVLALFGDWL